MADVADHDPPVIRFTLSRADGFAMGDYRFYDVTGFDDWEAAEADSDYEGDEAIEYVIERWVRVESATRSFINGRTP